MAKKKSKKAVVKSVKVKAPAASKNNLIAALILNIIIPGTGTLFLKKFNTGLLQLVLYGIGFFMTMMFMWLIGLPLMIIIWVWALTGSIRPFMK